MANVELATRIAASADKVWATFAGPEMVQLLLECYAAKVEVETDETAGVATFVTTLRSGGVLRERMESLDHAERCMKYRVLDAGPLPYANYRGRGARAAVWNGRLRGKFSMQFHTGRCKRARRTPALARPQPQGPGDAARIRGGPPIGLVLQWDQSNIAVA